MTVSSTTTRNSYSGDGSTTVFAYGFKIFDDDDITVIVRTNATGTESVQTKTTDYTVSGVGSASGGNITFGTAPASGTTVVLLRETAQTQLTDYTPNDPFPAASHEDALDKLTLLSQDTQDEVNRSIKLSRTNTMTSTEFTVGATDRANKIFAFDSSGELAVTQEIGTFRGDWAASTAYAQRDLVKDTSTNNIFIVNTAHTSSGSQPLTTNANSAKYDLIVDAATATTSSTSAASSATAAANSATAAANSATAAATSESNAAGSEAGVAADAAAAATSASSASTSATNASTSETNASNSASAAATSATNAATSATSASNSASAASTSETNAATSATTATTKASEASTSATNAATSETNASTSATAASTSASSAANEATAAAASAASAAASFDAFDDIYLGAKASAPTVDNDGDALTVGDLYFNTTSNELFIWNGSAFQAASPNVIGDTTPQLGGNLDLNGNDITGTGNLNVTGTITADAATIDNGVLTVNDAGTRKVEISGNGFGDFTSNPVLDGGIEFTNQFGHVFSAGVSNSNNFDVLDGATKIARFSGGGDISFYANDGTTQALFFDASTERLGLGTTSPSTKLHISGNASNASALSDTVTDFALKFDSATTGGNFSNAICFAEGNNVNASIASFDGGAGGAQGLVFGTGASNTEAMRIDSSGNVGIGTTATTGAKLKIDGGATAGTIVQAGNAQGGVILGAESSTAYINTTSSTPLAFEINNTERMRIDSSGNVGIGTSSPNKILHLETSGETVQRMVASTTNLAGFYFGDSGNGSIGQLIYDNSSDAMRFNTNAAEAARIDSTGQLMLNCTSDQVASYEKLSVNGSGGFKSSETSVLALWQTNTSGNIAQFFSGSGGTLVGSISVTGSATSYNETSDHRLKENVVAMTGAIDRVKALAPKRFNFIVEPDRTVDGFIAHEAQTVVPEAVTGTHNEVDDDGNAVMQGIDKSKLVPLLTGALQEAITKIEDLETRLAALEAN